MFSFRLFAQANFIFFFASIVCFLPCLQLQILLISYYSAQGLPNSLAMQHPLHTANASINVTVPPPHNANAIVMLSMFI